MAQMPLGEYAPMCGLLLAMLGSISACSNVPIPE